MAAWPIAATKVAKRAPAALPPNKILGNMELAFEEFLRDYPHIAREEALDMWKAFGG